MNKSCKKHKEFDMMCGDCVGMKSPCPQDKQIALTAINGLKGQAQYDFLMDYFKQLRAEGRRQAEEATSKIGVWGIGYRCALRKVRKIIEGIRAEDEFGRNCFSARNGYRKLLSLDRIKAELSKLDNHSSQDKPRIVVEAGEQNETVERDKTANSRKGKKLEGKGK